MRGRGRRRPSSRRGRATRRKSSMISDPMFSSACHGIGLYCLQVLALTQHPKLHVFGDDPVQRRSFSCATAERRPPIQQVTGVWTHRSIAGRACWYLKTELRDLKLSK
jgi:hypothetical protein